MKLLYQHPDGGHLLYSPRFGRLILSAPWDNDEETVAAVNIGLEGLRQLAADLYALAELVEAKQ